MQDANTARRVMLLLKNRRLKRICKRMRADPVGFIENATMQLIADSERDQGVYETMEKQLSYEWTK